MSDTTMIEATGVGAERLRALLALDNSRRVTGMAQTDKGLVLSWEHASNGPRLVPFPPAILTDQIMAWLINRDDKVVSNPDFFGAIYPKEPDIDGHCKKGWRLLIGASSDPITISPQWMIYHK
jgi:hypothetical protein